MTYALNTPYLSVVVPMRNDDHGGDMMRRFRASMETTWEQAERHRLEVEYLVVDYNPPADRPGIAEAVAWPTGMAWTSIRVVQVPAALHAARTHIAHRKLSYASAVNAGLRRARGRFVLPSTIDHLLSSELMAVLAKKDLGTLNVYRADRCDVDNRVLDIEGLDERLAFCRDHVLERFVRPPNPIHPMLPILHTDACGDFMLMAGPFWHRLRGFREDDPLCLHVDSIALYATYGLRMKEHFIPDGPIYHIDHEDTFTKKVRRGDVDSATGLTLEERYPEFEKIMIDLGLRRRQHDFNGPDWGFGGHDLPETMVWAASAWDG